MKSAEPVLDLQFVRDQFPSVGELAFFENAGGTYVPQSVIDKVARYMRTTQVQPGGDFAPSILAAERMAESHRLMAEMLNAAPEEVMIGISTSMNVYLLAQAVRHWFAPGDEVVVTNLDHEANNGAWRRLEEFGLKIREWQVNPETADLELDDLDALLNDHTRLVCVSQCSNITGSINDVAEIGRRVHDAGALICVDAVAYAPHRRLDVKALDVDFYLVSLYKLYGPHVSLLYGKRELLLKAKRQHHYFIPDDDIPLKLNPGGPNHEFTASLSGITDYFDSVHRHHFPGSNATLHVRMTECFDLITAHEERLAAPFVDFLRSKPGVRIIGRATADHEARVPTFSFVVDGRDSNEFPRHLATHDVGI
ncbi:MAG: aminotransferase class V-fold PLP-dependent enzyme, partial [Gammaproteobacteria bacterium]|nr:aminotransferase class V-fold PLP-dependent enzyme [Gammaproteobacteria bacterium]